MPSFAPMVTVAAMTTLNPTPPHTRLDDVEDLDHLLDLSGEITEITEFYLSLLDVQSSLACPVCGGSRAPAASAVADRQELISAELLTYLCALAQFDDIALEPEELFSATRQAQVHHFLVTNGCPPLAGVDVLAAVVGDTAARCGSEALDEAWDERWPGLLIPELSCSCVR